MLYSKLKPQIQVGSLVQFLKIALSKSSWIICFVSVQTNIIVVHSDRGMCYELWYLSIWGFLLFCFIFLQLILAASATVSSLSWAPLHLNCVGQKVFEEYELKLWLSLFADLVEAEAKELILDIKYPATKKQVNI